MAGERPSSSDTVGAVQFPALEDVRCRQIFQDYDGAATHWEYERLGLVIPKHCAVEAYHCQLVSRMKTSGAMVSALVLQFSGSNDLLRADSKV